MPDSADMPLYTAAQVRELDRRAIEDAGIDGYGLMCRAGEALYAQLQRDWPDAGLIVVLCGPGNNGGDGYVLARLLRAAGRRVQLLALSAPEQLQGAAARAAADFKSGGGAIETYEHSLPGDADLLVDALLGTGLSRPVDGLYARAIEQMNSHPAPVLAVDIASGLNADTGSAPGVAVQAAATVSFIGRKRGLYTGEGVQVSGRRYFSDLDVPAGVYAELSGEVRCLALSTPLLPRRSRNAHKGHFGHVLVVGGAPGFSGAARLSAEAAARSGSGLVSVATHPQHASGLNTGRPEIMVHGVSGRRGLDPLLERANALVAGPGLGQDAWARDLFEAVLATGLPLVVDADALNLLAVDPLRRDNWILTPHPGEAARLLGCSTRDIQQDRFAAVAELQANYGGVVVLKGAGTLLADGMSGVGLCPLGNPGMASGGMGDVLSGVTAAFLAQGMTPMRAAERAICVHAGAADRLAAAQGEHGLLAGDLIPEIRALINER